MTRIIAESAALALLFAVFGLWYVILCPQIPYTPSTERRAAPCDAWSTTPPTSCAAPAHAPN
jgi:hypothetical protein